HGRCRHRLGEPDPRAGRGDRPAGGLQYRGARCAVRVPRRRLHVLPELSEAFRGQGKKLTEAGRLLARGELRIGAETEEAQAEVGTALAAFGLYLDPGTPAQAPREWHLWPECLAAFELFLGVQTQWVVGMGGPLGLSYGGVEACLRLYGLKPA